MKFPMTTPRTPAFPDRLPHVGTTIFSTMSALAARHQAVNLGQGFPDFDCDPALQKAVSHAMRAGHNQYPPMPGLPALRQALSEKMHALYGRHYDADSEITITAGATQAIFNAILACTRPGDEVIVLEPCYDSYVPNIEMAGARAVRVPLTPVSFRPDMAKIAAAITPRTRALILNTPHNPGGSAWSAAEMRALETLLAPTDILVISDEVYEHMCYDGQLHQSCARFAQLAARAFIISSFGKTFHVTGWKVGSVAAPAPLTAALRKVHQFNVFTVNTPMQVALAHYLQNPAPYLQLSAFYQARRDLFCQEMAASRLRLLPAQGSYFVCADISQVTEQSEADFCQWLVREIGVAAIPLSAFYGSGFDQRLVRFCFAKRIETLRAAAQRLRRL